MAGKIFCLPFSYVQVVAKSTAGINLKLLKQQKLWWTIINWTY